MCSILSFNNGLIIWECEKQWCQLSEVWEVEVHRTKLTNKRQTKQPNKGTHPGNLASPDPCASAWHPGTGIQQSVQAGDLRKSNFVSQQVAIGKIRLLIVPHWWLSIFRDQS